MIRAYRYKMKPTRSQEAFLVKCFGCARFVYNHALRERMDAYTSD
ncbi:MAG: helix-turn-helix domain-containing protein, partial [Candidatus Methanomethylophilaceae archaeon]|nr:helix-turn-helix domain-containing protein [Candidatus Methanomethylophilaceae archaeon]